MTRKYMAGYLVVLFLMLSALAKSQTLNEALQKGDTALALTLIKSGVSPNQSEGDGGSLLINYCKWEEADPMAFFLLRQGAKPDTLRTAAGRTALHVAAAYTACEALCKALLEAGANINARTKDGATPLMLAALSAKLRLVNFLLEHGADPMLKDKKGLTAYDYALKADALADLPGFRQKMEAACGWTKTGVIEKLKGIIKP